MPVGPRIRGSHALPDRRQLGLGLFHHHALRQPAEGEQSRPLPPLVAQGICPQRRPVAVVHREGEPLGHHANHGVHGVSEPDIPSHDVRISLKARLPHVVANHHHRRRSVSLVLLDERPSQQRGHPSHLKSRSDHLSDGNRLDRSAGDDQVPLGIPESTQLLNRFQLHTPRDEIVQGWALSTVRCRVPVLKCDHAIALV